MGDGSTKQPRPFRGRFVSERSCQTEPHLCTSLVAELVARSALQQVPSTEHDATLADEAVHALLAALRYVQLHGVCGQAEALVAEAYNLAKATGPSERDNGLAVSDPLHALCRRAPAAEWSPSAVAGSVRDATTAHQQAAQSQPPSHDDDASAAPHSVKMLPKSLVDDFDVVKRCLLHESWKSQVHSALAAVARSIQPSARLVLKQSCLWHDAANRLCMPIIVRMCVS